MREHHSTEKVLDVMNFMEVSLGKFGICVEYKKVMNTLVRLVRWGDEIFLSGRRWLCNAFRDDLEKHLLVKTTAVFGIRCRDGRCAGSDPPEQTAKTVPSRCRGR